MADVLEAVTYVSGVDPCTKGMTKSVVQSRLLAVHALREITESSTPAIARALGYADHTTPLRRLSTPVDYDDLREVVGVVASILEDEDRALELARWG